MDTLTHALSGALLARATASRDAPPRSLPRRIAAGFLAAAAPDLDIVFSLFGPLTYLENHRGITHSILLLPLWAFLLAWLLAKILREPGGWRALYGVSAMGLGAHIAGDLITSFGTIIFAPFSDWRAGIGTTFIIDLWFTGIILVGLGTAWYWRGTRLPAVIASAVLAGYVGFQYTLKQQAIEFGEQYARKLGLREASVVAQPRPVSPFNWSVYLSDAEQHRYANINLIRRETLVAEPDAGFLARLDAAYQPLSSARWQQRSRYGDTLQDRRLALSAWNSDALGFLRWFAELPAFDRITTGSQCVWFVDLRFTETGRPWVPFNYGACRDNPAATWRAHERVGTAEHKLLR